MVYSPWGRKESDMIEHAHTGILSRRDKALTTCNNLVLVAQPCLRSKRSSGKLK